MYRCLVQSAVALALFEEAVGAVMPELGVSVHKMRKLLHGIHERLVDVAPGFFGDTVAVGGDGKLGPEKCRQGLAYMRQCLDVRRPWVPA